jgi:hypothetical protein
MRTSKDTALLSIASIVCSILAYILFRFFGTGFFGMGAFAIMMGISVFCSYRVIHKRGLVNGRDRTAKRGWQDWLLLITTGFVITAFSLVFWNTVGSNGFLILMGIYLFSALISFISSRRKRR